MITDAIEDAEFELPEDDLRTELTRLNNEVRSDLATLQTSNISESEKALTAIYSAVSDKYGINTSYQDFKSYLSGIADATKFDKAINDALGAKVTDAIATRAQMRLMASMGYVIDRMGTLIEQEAATSPVVTPEMVGMVQKSQEWVKMLQEIKANNPIKDPDKAIERALEADKREHPDKYKTGEGRTIETDNMALIQQLLTSLNS